MEVNSLSFLHLAQGHYSRTTVCWSTCQLLQWWHLWTESDRPAAAAVRPSGGVHSASFKKWAGSAECRCTGGGTTALAIEIKCTFLHGGEVGPLLGRQLHLSPHDLQRDAIAVRRVRRLKHNTDNNRKNFWESSLEKNFFTNTNFVLNWCTSRNKEAFL